MLVDTRFETCNFAPAFGQVKETKTRVIPEHFLEDSVGINEGKKVRSHSYRT